MCCQVIDVHLCQNKGDTHLIKINILLEYICLVLVYMVATLLLRKRVNEY